MAHNSTDFRSTSTPRLNIERLFTTKGVHPYDEVNWERRDVVQNNWKTGEIVFEQKGVEFPDFWSMNASTIVTTKYFRGALGTDEREQSLRQLIDRVVDTYTAAARENGYITNDDDLEIFDHELKWMLLHQVFSFNSPVWFNVGTTSPQQVSACFILSVDDTMDSILNWYREEGMIFKGGSGAGLNISRIRSSKELLASSGGSASGPVSFMRGADASAGTIKSGGATRRAAKMVVLDVDHPDIVEFVETKEKEEEKIRVLRDAGFDMDLGGADIISVQYQNANNSVRVSDEFMTAVEEGAEFGLRARTTGDVVDTVDAKSLFRKMAAAAWACADPGIQYDDTINRWHTNPETGRITASNPCSEYMSLDNSSCNLASLNLMKFRDADGVFDVEKFVKAVEFVITAMEISISFADFPTEAIGQTTREYRQLGIGYANLGALLMASGVGYDSPEGRAYAAAITSLMTGVAYRRSAEIAGIVGPYEGYARNRVGHTRVMEQHRDAAKSLVGAVAGDDDTVFVADGIVGEYPPAVRLAERGAREWKSGLKIGKANGWRNAQASVLAPTGCIVPGSMVLTDRGLARIGGIGDQNGAQWQDVTMKVATDEGPMDATKFFINGVAPTRKITTGSGYSIQGTPEHRIKVVDAETGEWVWRRFAEVSPEDVVPMMLGGMIGETHDVLLPALGEAYWTEDRDLRVPSHVTAELAEFIGYFMGDGSLHAKGLRFAIDGQDSDLVQHFTELGQRLFGVTAVARENVGYTDLYFNSVRLSLWMEAAGFAKRKPNAAHTGKGYVPHVPSAILETNNPDVYAAFLRGLFEADGSASQGMPGLDTSSESFADEIKSMLLALGYPTHSKTATAENRFSVNPIHRLRVRSSWWNESFGQQIGFLSDRKKARLQDATVVEVMKADFIHLPDEDWSEILSSVPSGSEVHNALTQAVRKRRVSRALAHKTLSHVPDERLEAALGYIFETVTSNEDGGEQFTYDLSVPENTTYIANGFISHNTIGFMMDCDTTGIEPDFALVKFKKLVGGSSLEIVNQQVSEALRSLGYQAETIEAIEEYIAEHGYVVGAPGLSVDHYGVFDCAVGDERAITPDGHIHMMAAVQPFISGAISKTVNLPESATIEEIERVYFDGWKLGLKAIAVYRNNCKVGQPLSDSKSKTESSSNASAEPEVVEKIVERIIEKPVRRRLPKKRNAETVSFTVGGTEGYLTNGLYEDGQPGEVFVKMSKQGSTLAGIMDAFSIAVSLGLQYGVPLEAYVAKFTNMRFEPSGMTDDPDIRMAQSILDYIFRRIALDHMSFEERSAFGIYTAQERTESLNDGGYSDADASTPPAQDEIAPKAEPSPEVIIHHEEAEKRSGTGLKIEAPMCLACGTAEYQVRTGACFTCLGCSGSSGCS